MVFFGGVNSLTGAVVSTLLRRASGSSAFRVGIPHVLLRVLVLLIINFKPSGLFGEFELPPKGIRHLFARWQENEGKLCCLKQEYLQVVWRRARGRGFFHAGREIGNCRNNRAKRRGKTSVFNVVAGIYKADAGSVILDGEDNH